MAFDFSTLVTDRTQQDVDYARQLVDKLVTGTATDKEKAEWNSFTLKGAYNHTDLNRVTAAMEDLVSRLRRYGYSVDYTKIRLPRADSTRDIMLKPNSIVQSDTYNSYTFDISNLGTYMLTVTSGGATSSQIVVADNLEQNLMLDMTHRLQLYAYGDECTAVTGGWSSDGFSSVLPATKLENSFYVDATTSYSDMLSTVNKINCSGYSKLCIDWIQTDAENPYQPWVGLLKSREITDRAFRTEDAQVTNVRHTSVYDITELNGEYYVAFCHTNGTYSGSGHLYALWLE